MTMIQPPRRLPIGCVEIPFVDAILAIEESLRNSDARWAVGGDVADAMRGVDAKPSFIEIFTDEGGAHRIREAVSSYNPTEVQYAEERLSRDAMINADSYPVYIRSHCFEFKVGKSVNVKVRGDVQYRVGDWEWGDKLEFTPEPLSLVGTWVSLVPQTLRLDLYRNLGWADKVDAISDAIAFQSEDRPAWDNLT